MIDPNVFVSALMTKPGSPTLAVAQAVTTSKLTLVACPADPDDDYLFALAATAEARVIVSGDGKVQAVDVPGIDVMSPRAAADELDKL